MSNRTPTVPPATWDLDMPVRDLMAEVIVRWYPDDDAPYQRVDELLAPAVAAGYEFGVTTEMIDRWCNIVTERNELLHAGQAVGKQFLSNACIHDDHDRCEQECSYCEDGCACGCHPWNVDTVKCSRCGGSGIDPDDPVQRTAKGLSKNEHMPCAQCGGSGEVVGGEGATNE